MNWISTTEEVPPDLESVLTCYKDQGEKWCVGIGWHSTKYKEWRLDFGWMEDAQISYWMPLPEPPKEEKR